MPDTSALVTPVFAAGDKEYYDTYFQVTPKPGRAFPTLRALAPEPLALPPTPHATCATRAKQCLPKAC